MTMPMLPALMDQAAAPASPSLVDLLSGLDELAMGELVAAAEAAGFGGEALPADDDVEVALEDGEEAAEPVDGEVVEEEETEEAGDDEAEPSEQDVEEVAAQGFAQITDWANTAREAFGPMLEQLEQLQTTAEAGVEAGADADSIEPLVAKGNELIEQADEAVTECLDAAGAEDAHGCALAALKLERLSRVFSKLVEQASAFAETTSAPEAGFNDEPAVKLWAERTAPKAGPLPI